MVNLHVTGETWIISDTHWSDAEIQAFGDRPLNHEQLMLDNWRRLVEPGDVVLHLGDVLHKPDAADLAAIASLPGRVYFIRGNWDHLSERWFSTMLGYTEVAEFTQEIDGHRVRFSHRPAPLGDWSVNIHGHLHQAYWAKREGDVLRINMSVERRQYRPTRVREILSRVGQ